MFQVSDEKFKYIHTAHEKVTAKMYDYKCDIKLKVGKQIFRGHRDVLGEASDYFCAMFGHNMREKEQDTIEIHEISPSGFTSMLEYFYHGHVTIDANNIEDVLEAARFFHIEWLIQVCCDFLIHHLCLENYQGVLTLADKYYLGDLRFDIFKFIGKNFTHLAEKSKFLNLSQELFYQILVEDYYVEASESCIFQTVMKWLKHKAPSREEHMVSLLQLIRYPLMEPEDLEHMPEEVMADPLLKELVIEAREYHSNPTRQCLMSVTGTEPRGGQNVIMLISGLEDANLIQYKIPGMPGFYSEEIDTSFLHSVFEFAAVATLGNFLFIAGGYGRHSWCSSPAFYRYNPSNRSWMQLTSMHQPRVSFSLCAADTGLYAIAGIEHILVEGMDRENILDTVEFYDPESGLWNVVPSLAVGCFSIAASFHKGTLYVTGGISDDPEDEVPTNTLRVFSPGRDFWEPKAPMLVSRQGHSMSSYKNKLYVFGGFTTGLDTMSFSDCLLNEMYDIETDQWSQLCDTPEESGHLHGSVTMLDNKIFIIGGKSADRFLGSYNLETEELEEGEYCGPHVQRAAAVKVAFPFDVE